MTTYIDPLRLFNRAEMYAKIAWQHEPAQETGEHFPVDGERPENLRVQYFRLSDEITEVDFISTSEGADNGAA